ncbi:MAG: putative DNA modification/repair radical SAM protein [Sphingobacteriales bacterium]|nr:MAG: putative DNA modification/repair radical SAM protein [Sphingobacteriales bacterium]
MDWERVKEKLGILSDAAKYDVSCSSSGSKRANKDKGLGDTTGMGICHSYTEDGRCVSLLKILLTNHCIFDCAYCVSRKSNDVKRAAFTVDEVVDLTINFYRRNYIEGLFLSSGIFKDADFTMERLVRVVKKLRTEHRFNGYIHLKAIPGASEELLREAAIYADRLSVNIELPSEQSLKLLAPEKNYNDIEKPMGILSAGIEETKASKSLLTPKFAPAGQSTQMVIGATPETDKDIVYKAAQLYKGYGLKRVYYSGYVPVSADLRLPEAQVPFLREHRLYQADWLMRLYQFQPEEIVSNEFPQLDAAIDPKLAWALRNLHLFPIDINTAEYEMILRVPGIGIGSAKKIISARTFGKLNWDQLKQIGITISRAKYFIVCSNSRFSAGSMEAATIRHQILKTAESRFTNQLTRQLPLF